MFELSLIGRDEVAGWTGDQRQHIGEMVAAAVPEFYDHVPIPRADLYDILAGQVAEPGTETEFTYGAYDDGRLVGFISVVETDKLAQAQQGGSIALMRAMSPDQRAAFRSALSDYHRVVAPVTTPGGRYLPRMAVFASERGRGLGRVIMRNVLSLFPAEPFVLHVAHTNAPTVKIHTSLGFEWQSDPVYPIGVMVRPPVADVPLPAVG